MNYYLLSVRKMKDVMVKDLKLWRLNEPELKVVEQYDDKYWNYTRSYVDAYVLIGEKPDKGMRLDDLNFMDEDLLLVETKKLDGTFVFR